MFMILLIIFIIYYLDIEFDKLKSVNIIKLYLFFFKFCFVLDILGGYIWIIYLEFVK